MEDKENSEFLLDIQKWWEVPCIAQFISLFGVEFNIPIITIETLERMLLNRGVDSVSGSTVHELVVSLLRGIYKSHKSAIQLDSYMKFVRRFIKRKCLPISIDLGDDFDIYTEFIELPVRNQVLLLHSLCYLRLEPELDKCDELFRADSADRYRAAPLGEDSKKNTYWYFSGMRLYKEEFITEDERLWNVVCFNEADWINLSSQFETSRNANEKELFQNLQEIIPVIHKMTVKQLRIERLNRYTVSGGEISAGNFISTRTRSTRRNSIK